MKINCELPLQLLDWSNDYNEYDFVLFHLLKNQKYANWVMSQRVNNPGRLMILDNSAYEMYVKGEEINWDEFVDAIIKFQPDYYILPDKLMDYDTTMIGSKEFLDTYSNRIRLLSTNTPKPLAVAQGNSDEELLKAIFEYQKMDIEYIGIPFHLSYFREGKYPPALRTIFHCMGYEETEDVKYAMGRVRFVAEYADVLKRVPKIHFLGSHCPYEKFFYHNFATMDTGYPVKLAMEGKRLGEEDEKPKILVDDYLDKELTKAQTDLIMENIQTFKNL